MIDDKIVGFIEVLIPITACNIKCEYCYIIQRHNRSMHIPSLSHSPKEIAYALRPERFNGAMYISLCGAGETMMLPDIADIVKELVIQGHLVNITTNGTITKAIDKLLEVVPSNLYNRINVSFSYHYLELQRTKLTEVFWNNIKKIRSSGMSFVVQLNLYDGYVKHLENIKKDSLLHVGALPQIAATRNEIDLEHKHKLLTDKSNEEYLELGREFQSPLFEFTMSNFMKKQKGFCYAGKWSFVLNLGSGIIKPCYQSIYHINIFDNLDKPIKFFPVGRHCVAPFCMNSSHFLSLGNIPTEKCPTYSELRNRECADGTEWYNPTFKNHLSQKFNSGNSIEYTYKDKILIAIVGVFNKVILSLADRLPKKLIKRIKNKYK